MWGWTSSCESPEQQKFKHQTKEKTVSHGKMGNSVTDHISPCSNWMTSSESKTQWCLSRKFQSFPSLTFKCLVWVFNPPFMISWPWYAQSNYYVAFPWLVQDFFVTKVCSRSALCFSTVTVNSLHGNVYFPMANLLYYGYHYLQVSHRGRAVVKQMVFPRYLQVLPPSHAMLPSLLSSGGSREAAGTTLSPGRSPLQEVVL